MTTSIMVSALQRPTLIQKVLSFVPAPSPSTYFCANEERGKRDETAKQDVVRFRQFLQLATVTSSWTDTIFNYSVGSALTAFVPRDRRRYQRLFLEMCKACCRCGEASDTTESSSCCTFIVEKVLKRLLLREWVEHRKYVPTKIIKKFPGAERDAVGESLYRSNAELFSFLAMELETLNKDSNGTALFDATVVLLSRYEMEIAQCCRFKSEKIAVWRGCLKVLNQFEAKQAQIIDKRIRRKEPCTTLPSNLHQYLRSNPTLVVPSDEDLQSGFSFVQDRNLLWHRKFRARENILEEPGLLNSSSIFVYTTSSIAAPLSHTYQVVPLISEAARSGRLDLVKFFVEEAGMDPDFIIPSFTYNHSPLVLAVMSSHRAVVEYLLTKMKLSAARGSPGYLYYQSIREWQRVQFISGGSNALQSEYVCGGGIVFVILGMYYSRGGYGDGSDILDLVFKCLFTSFSSSSIGAVELYRFLVDGPTLFTRFLVEFNVEKQVQRVAAKFRGILDKESNPDEFFYEAAVANNCANPREECKIAFILSRMTRDFVAAAKYAKKRDALLVDRVKMMFEHPKYKMFDLDMFQNGEDRTFLQMCLRS